jgi:hypothetical protein
MVVGQRSLRELGTFVAVASRIGPASKLAEAELC